MPKPKKHYEPVKAFVPINLPNIDHLGLPFSSIGLNPDRIRAIYHLLYMLRGKSATNDKYNSTDSFRQGWVNISSGLLTKVGTRAYSKYLNWMEANNGLEIRRDEFTGNKKYGRGLFSIQYRIPRHLLHNPNSVRHYKKELITNHCTLKAIYSLRDSFSTPHSKAVFQPLPIHYTMFDMLKEFCFDIERADEFLTRVASGELEGKYTKKGSERDLGSLLLNMEAFNDGDISFTCDAFGERFHTPVTNAWKQIRPFLKLRNDLSEKLICLDIKNSQPFFASISAQADFIKAVLPEFEPSLSSLSGQHQGPDLVEFAGLCARGDIYEKWATLRSITRDAAKEEMFYIMFSKNKTLKDLPGIVGAPCNFAYNFPSVSNAFRAIKNTTENTLPFIKNLFLNKYGQFMGRASYHSVLSCAMQRAESRVIRIIAQKMLDEGIGPFITVHDSFILPLGKSARAAEIMEDVFRFLNTYPPTIKTSIL